MILDGPALLDEIRIATEISEHALARKLGVHVEQINKWSTGHTPIPPKVLQRLEAFYQRTQEPGQDGPREQRPHLDSALVHGDSLRYLKTLPSECVDLILSDIPYGIGLDSWDVLHENSNSGYLGRSAAQTLAGAAFDRRRKPINGWSTADRAIPQAYYDWCAQWAIEWLRVLKPGGTALVFAGRRLSPRCAVALEDAGFNLREQLAWLRPKALLRAQRLSTVFKRRGELDEASRWEGWRLGNPRPSFEPILWFGKPYTSTLTDTVLDHHLGAFNLSALEARFKTSDNVIKCGFEAGERGHHPAQKPLKLLSGLIELTTCPGQLVLDPFAGSGSTAIAASRIGRRYVVIEKDEHIYKVAAARLSEEEECPPSI